jgi:hypothetical protein
LLTEHDAKIKEVALTAVRAHPKGLLSLGLSKVIAWHRKRISTVKLLKFVLGCHGLRAKTRRSPDRP